MRQPQARHPRAVRRALAIGVTCTSVVVGAGACARDGGDDPASTTASAPSTTPSGVTAPSSSPTSTPTSTSAPVVTETATETATATATSTSGATPSGGNVTTPGTTDPTGAPGGSTGPSGSTQAPGAATATPGTVTASGYAGFTFGMPKSTAVTKARAEGYQVSELGVCTVMKKQGVALVSVDGSLGMIAVDRRGITTDRGVGVGTTFSAAKKAYPGATYQDVARLVAREGKVSTVFTFSQEQAGSVVTYLTGRRAYVENPATCE